MHVTSALAAANSTSLACALLSAIGFSIRTCLPARIADNANGASTSCGVAISTASMSTASSKVRKRLKGTDTLVERRHSAPRFGVRIGSRDQPELLGAHHRLGER